MSDTGKEYGELMREIRKQKEPHRIEYALKKISELGLFETIEESSVFPTKEELLKSL